VSHFRAASLVATLVVSGCGDGVEADSVHSTELVGRLTLTPMTTGLSELPLPRSSAADRFVAEDLVDEVRGRAVFDESANDNAPDDEDVVDGANDSEGVVGVAETGDEEVVDDVAKEGDDQYDDGSDLPAAGSIPTGGPCVTGFECSDYTCFSAGEGFGGQCGTAEGLSLAPGKCYAHSDCESGACDMAFMVSVASSVIINGPCIGDTTWYPSNCIVPLPQ